MKQKDYEQFLQLTTKRERELQKEVDGFIIAAMTEAENGDLVIAGELMREAARIITKTVEYDNLCNRANAEINALVERLEVDLRPVGGLCD
jgi:hypothetical protein